MMLQLVTDAVISKGYGGAPAFYSSEDGRMISFKIGCKVYDKKADKETRWVNLNVNAFDDLAERVRRMNLKEGSHINLVGTFDMKPWVNRETGEITAWPTIRATNIEYAASLLPKQDAQAAQKAAKKKKSAEGGPCPAKSRAARPAAGTTFRLHGIRALWRCPFVLSGRDLAGSKTNTCPMAYARRSPIACAFIF